jgi:hypothetical protein
MNERIRELIREAESTTNEGIGFEGQEYLDMLMERFAELIVQECLDVVAMRIYLGPEEICRQECKALASEIKEHFGVEE